MSRLTDVVLQFDLAGQIDSIKPLGNGLINDTYKVETVGGPSYVLQRINHNIFKDVDLLQNNIVSVTSHIRRKLEAAGASDVDRKVLTFIPEGYSMISVRKFACSSSIILEAPK